MKKFLMEEIVHNFSDIVMIDVKVFLTLRCNYSPTYINSLQNVSDISLRYNGALGRMKEDNVNSRKGDCKSQVIVEAQAAEWMESRVT